MTHAEVIYARLSMLCAENENVISTERANLLTKLKADINPYELKQAPSNASC
jgi:hypothetical protein